MSTLLIGLSEMPAAIWVGALRWTAVLLIALVVTSSAARLSPAGRHRVWVLTILALALGPFLGRLAPLWHLPAPEGWPAGAERAQATSGPSESVAAAVLAERQPGAMPPVVPSPPPSAVEAFEPAHSWPAWSFGLVGAWLVGVAVLLVSLAVTHLRLRRALVTASSASEADRRLLASCTGSLGMTREPRLLLSGTSVPMTWGWRRPVIVLPELSRHWPLERRRAVLLHELCHVRRGDSATNAFASVIGAIFWPHPGVWYAARRLRREAELAVDAAVVDTGLEPGRYGGHLLAIARELSGRVPGLAAGASSSLGSRIEALADPRERRHAAPWRLAVGVLLLVASAVALPGWRALASSPDASDAVGLQAGVVDPDGSRSWTLPCTDVDCEGGTRKALELLSRTGKSGAVVVQRVADGALQLVASRRPAEVTKPLASAPVASLAKLTLAALWWQSGRGDVERPCPTSYRTRAGQQVSNNVRHDLGTISVPREMLILSCNTAASAMADELLAELGVAELRSRLEALGPANLGLAGRGAPGAFARDWPSLAAGLGPVTASPLEVSALLRSIGSDGVKAGDQRVVSSATAARLRSAMDGVISDGTARRVMPQLEWSAWRLGGKTATALHKADVEGSDPAPKLDGWFAGLAYGPSGAPRYTIVVLLEDGGTGGGAAAGIAAEMTRYLARAAGDDL